MLRVIAAGRGVGVWNGRVVAVGVTVTRIVRTPFGIRVGDLSGVTIITGVSPFQALVVGGGEGAEWPAAVDVGPVAEIGEPEIVASHAAPHAIPNATRRINAISCTTVNDRFMARMIARYGHISMLRFRRFVEDVVLVLRSIIGGDGALIGSDRTVFGGDGPVLSGDRTGVRVPG